jgi:hypothetical protein
MASGNGQKQTASDDDTKLAEIWSRDTLTRGCRLHAA